MLVSWGGAGPLDLGGVDLEDAGEEVPEAGVRALGEPPVVGFLLVADRDLCALSFGPLSRVPPGLGCLCQMILWPHCGYG